jgi:hypothetical protein
MPDPSRLRLGRRRFDPSTVVQGNLEKWSVVAEMWKPTAGVAVCCQLLTQIDLTTGSTPSAGASARALWSRLAHLIAWELQVPIATAIVSEKRRVGIG